METSQFQRVLRLGLGRSILFLRHHDGSPYRDLILDACLHNRAHDPQVEGSRAEYMIDVIRESGEATHYADAVLASLSDPEHSWDTPQRFELARRLAQSGNADARKAMYAAFEARHFSGSDVALEFILLDRLEGLLFVVKQIGAQLVKNPEQWEDEYLLDEARRLCGRETVDAAMRDAAGSNANVASYLDAVAKNAALSAATDRPDPRELTYAQIGSLIEAGRAGGVLAQWGQNASDSDLDAAALHLINENDQERLKSYLTIFRKRRFPLEVSYLLKLAELPDGPVPRHALGVLANLHDEGIRSLALKMVETGSSKRAYSIDLLVHNFQNGDHRLVEAWCEAESEPEIVNAFDRSLRDFFAAHPDTNVETRLLHRLYEKEPCAHCRFSIVERLKQLGFLAEEMRRECECDSYADTRSLVKEGKSN